ncbi:MAG: SprB repeat-containing protein [Flavobacteriales bacterium]
MYSICVQDEAGCTLTVDVEVVDAEAVMAEVTSMSISCNGEQDGSISVSAMGGTGTYTYSIDGVNLPRRCKLYRSCCWSL